MGNSVAKAKEAANKELESINSLIQTLENKLAGFELEIALNRGSIASLDDKEVKGGRSVARLSEIRVNVEEGADDNITSGVEDFFSAATNGVNGQSDIKPMTKLDIVKAYNSEYYGNANDEEEGEEKDES